MFNVLLICLRKGGFMSKNKFYTCKNDKCFKCIFLNPLNEDLLRLIIKESIGITISKISYASIEKNSNNIKIKRKYLDVLLDAGSIMIGIEVNAKDELYIKPRNTSYQCDNYANDVKVRGVYDENKDIIQINFSYGLKDNKRLRIYTISDDENHQYVKNFKIYEINMDYYMNLWYNKSNEEVNIKIIKYRYFIMLNLSLSDLDELIKITNGDERIVKYMNELKKVNDDPKYREYISEEDDIRFIKNSIKNEAMREGLEEGRAKGIAQGMAEGMAEGIKLKQFEIAKELLRDNMSVSSVSKYTGLSINQINNIIF